jgi:hypothetical protein
VKIKRKYVSVFWTVSILTSVCIYYFYVCKTLHRIVHDYSDVSDILATVHLKPLMLIFLYHLGGSRRYLATEL